MILGCEALPLKCNICSRELTVKGTRLFRVFSDHCALLGLDHARGYVRTVVRACFWDGTSGIARAEMAL